ncbi:MAG: hypothetical protein K0R10_912 [Alphaproteobacteria bacterium]|jgi:hypothetical protein|nr:hypothetical protein [Alphaproteobacteria bacterium]
MRLLAAFALLLIFCVPASAAQKRTQCNCMAEPLEKRWEKSGAVFTGTVAEAVEVKEWSQRGNADMPLIVTVKVDQGYKGVEKGNTFKFYSNKQVNTCMGADFEAGKSYLFFAYQRAPDVYERWSLYDFPSGTYDVGGLCGGTRASHDAATAAEIAEIEKLPKDGKLLTAKEGVIGLPPEKPMATTKE